MKFSHIPTIQIVIYATFLKVSDASEFQRYREEANGFYGEIAAYDISPMAGRSDPLYVVRGEKVDGVSRGDGRNGKEEL